MNEVNTNNGSQEIIEYIYFDNVDGDRVLYVDLQTNITDVVDSCDGTNDLVADVWYLGQEVIDGGNITIPGGQTNLSVTTTAKDMSCPGSILTTISLSG